MNKITIPGSGVKITPLTFGAWAIGGWFWGGTDEQKSVEAIRSSIDMGMTTIDTAPVYGFGKSEELVGKAVKGKRSEVEILTKFGLVWDKKSNHIHIENTQNELGKTITIYRSASKESVIEECENSLRRLNTDYIDLFQLHWPNNCCPIEETMEALEILKMQGKIRAVGVSNFDAKQMGEAEKFGFISSNQVPYSMVFRNIEKELVPYCIKNNKSIIVYSPLQRGILTGKIKPGHQFSEGDHRPKTPFYAEPNLSAINRFLTEIEPIAKEKNVTLAQMVIKWTLLQAGIDCVLIGARNTEQVKENIAAYNVSISDSELEFINGKLNNLRLKL